MPRRLRPIAAGAVYHVMARGNNAEDVFRDALDRKLYLDLLAGAGKLLSVRILAYTLMSNHIHLVVQTTKPNIPEFIHRIHGRYAIRFNRRHGRKGHLYCERYRSSLVQRDSYLLELTRYIHLNPVRAGLVQQPDEYPWSSYLQYVRPDRNGGLADPAPVLDLLALDAAKGRAAYRDFVLVGLSRSRA